jgi:hypothetical protein
VALVVAELEEKEEEGYWCVNRLVDNASTGWREGSRRCSSVPPFRHATTAATTTLSQALFEYLLIVTGTKAGVDPSSPYDSLAQVRWVL